MRLPKNFQPVGASKHGIFFFAQTMSTAPEVGIDLAAPFSPEANWGIVSAFATIMASESEGETKNCDPIIMLRSASPSAAAPNVGGGAGVSIFLPSLFKPIVATSSTAYVRFGSA